MSDHWTPVVQKAQAQDSAALLELLHEFDNLIQAAARHFQVPHNERSDLLQESYLGFLKAVYTFDPARGHPFAAHAKTQTRAAVWQFLRVKNRTTSREIVYSAGDSESSEGESPLELTVDPQAEDNFSELEWRELLASLSERQALAVQRLVIDGYSMTELARLEGVHPDTVNTWKQRAFAKIKAELKKRPGRY
ncbi:RNA polymerase sigma factor [Tumebacillus permanentifrigoris]|uniref:RNA polymerase sigma factor (Sigma-70 family) n=1 Tax=Tumebacillus permanentifrigoris TaxID=378543 RepID=A0A316DF75_9BACL|nr:sigma-70 family RNA polymerase sigma factor [Tumebacillus permanentifrigoris]PWK16238.1 RNA polymerase sigma factor (sigma-70 family) [Tumebacillus permanentifrigoris]